MQITKHQVVSIHYTLKDDEGNLVDSSEGSDPLVYLHGERNIISGLEAALEGKAVGDDVKVRVAPADGYGERDDSRQQKVPVEMFGGQEVNAGAQFHAEDEEGGGITVTVVAVEDDGVVIDANHPLAGVHLNFEVNVVDIRAASEEEIEHGHVHGAGGHHH